MRTVKSWWLILAFVSGFALAMAAEELILNWHDNRLELSAPHVHFLAGKPLEALHNAAPVPFDFQVTLWSGSHNHLFQRVADRFVVSYDVWQQDFKVTKLQAPVKAAAHLTAHAAETWCLQQMSLDLTGLPDVEPFWVRLEIRAEDGKNGSLFGRGDIGDSRAQPDQAHRNFQPASSIAAVALGTVRRWSFNHRRVEAEPWKRVVEWYVASMNRLRNRLILVFLAASLLPVSLTLWTTLSLLDRSLELAPLKELDAVSPIA